MSNALVVLRDGAQTAGVQVDGDTCLNHVAALALLIAPDVKIALFGETEAKWCGRGQRDAERAS